MKGLAMGLIFVFTGVYVYAGLTVSNCYLDKGIPRTISVRVEDKHSTDDKVTLYYLQLSPWGRFAKSEDVDVSKALYQQVEPGDSVRVSLMPGRWSIPWFYVWK